MKVETSELPPFDDPTGYYELSGSGAYEGLSAFLIEEASGAKERPLNGIIFPGGFPPDR